MAAMNPQPEGLRPGFQRLIYPNRGLSSLVRQSRDRIVDDTWFHSGYPQTTWTEDLAFLKRRGIFTESSRIAYLGCGDDTEVQKIFPGTTNVDIMEPDPLPKNFLLADATNLPFNDESFDGVIIRAFGGPLSVYAETSRILKPEGVALVADNLRPMDHDHIPTETEKPTPFAYLSFHNSNLVTLRTLGESGLGLVEPLSFQAAIASKGLMTSAERAEIEQLMNQNREHLIRLLETRDWKYIEETPKLKATQVVIGMVRFLIRRLRNGKYRSTIPEFLEELKKAQTGKDAHRICGIITILKGKSSARNLHEVVPELLLAIEEHSGLISPKAKEKILLEIGRFERHISHKK